MKLTEKDKNYLRNLGNKDADLKQIEEAANVTTYTNRGKRISRNKAIELLGREEWLSGISRSAFHWTAGRMAKDNTEVDFDSSRLFK